METYKQIKNPDSGKYKLLNKYDEDVLLLQPIRQVDLNEDVLREILSHVDIQSVFQLCQVNKTLCHQHDDLFQRIYQRLYSQTGMAVFKNKTAAMKWFQLLKLCYQLSRLRLLLPSLKNYTMKALYTMIALNLSNQQIKVLLPEMGQLSHLQYLDLSNNQLSALPPEMGQLIHLQTLYLFKNQLNALPPEMGQLSHLQYLNLSNNQLSALPPEIGQLINLQELSLSYNQLSELPPEIGQLRALQYLYLSKNNFSSVFINKLTRQLLNTTIRF
ncbi:MAG TPA: leucine-rich repeat domain-containing protein [Candidatus Saccharimonadales bacterium]|nr:leucine-rich repeat domain-containing protein [Candidatus Saccharimonadales bacterium]